MRTNCNVFNLKINRYAIDDSYKTTRNHIQTLIGVLGSTGTYIRNFSLLDLVMIFYHDIVVHLSKSRDYKKQMTRNSK